MKDKNHADAGGRHHRMQHYGETCEQRRERGTRGERRSESGEHGGLGEDARRGDRLAVIDGGVRTISGGKARAGERHGDGVGAPREDARQNDERDGPEQEAAGRDEERGALRAERGDERTQQHREQAESHLAVEPPHGILSDPLRIERSQRAAHIHCRVADDSRIGPQQRDAGDERREHRRRAPAGARVLRARRSGLRRREQGVAHAPTSKVQTRDCG